MEPAKSVMTYKDLSSFEMNQTLMKIANTPTTAARAVVIRKVIAAIQKIRDKISADYKSEIYEVFFQKGDDGKLKMDEEGQPMPIEGKEDEIRKLTEEFGKRTVEITSRFNLHMLGEMKQISPREIEVLGDLLSDEEGGPGVPHFPGGGAQPGNVTQLRN